MDITLNRLKTKRVALVRKPQQPVDDAAWSSIALPTQRKFIRKLRAITRMVLLSVWTTLALPVQAALMLAPHPVSLGFSQFYWRVLSRLIGLDVRMIGALANRTRDGRPVVFVSNHSSWLDILVLGGRLPAYFIAKEEIGRWPVVRTVARLGRTLYVRRTRASTGRERDDMVGRLSGGDNLILFPEGTTSDGSRVMPFRSAFLSIAELPVTPQQRTPIIQPVSLVYDRLAGLPLGRAARPLFAWYGDMDLASHFWRLAQHENFRASVLLHPPLDPECFAGRKELSAACWTIIAGGASTLRQNRPAVPSITPAHALPGEAGPAFAQGALV